MLMNYHELTMDEPRNSKSRQLQFRVICVVMAVCIVWALISSGALRPVEVTDGVFPGGEFIYKFTGRDYAASQSLVNDCGKDLGVREIEQGNILYTLYLDDPLAVNGRRQRFASGYLFNDQTVTKKQESNEERKRILTEVNSQIPELSETEMEEMSAFELWPKLKYSFVELPSVKAAVVEYKYSGGFVSALVHSYKLFPAIRKYAKEMGAPGNPPVVITTCNMKDNMCTHYVPLEDPGHVFRLGTREYTPEEYGGSVDWDGVRNMFLKIITLGTKGGEEKEVATKIEKASIKKAPEPIPNEEEKLQEQATVTSDTPVEEKKEEIVSEPETSVEERAPEAEESTTGTPETPAETETTTEEAQEEAAEEPVQKEEQVEAAAQTEVPPAEESHATEELTHSKPAEGAGHEEVPPAEESRATEEATPESSATVDEAEQENVQQTPDRDEL